MGVLYRPHCGHDEDFAFPRYFHYSLIGMGSWPTEDNENGDWFRFKKFFYILWNWINIGFGSFLTLSMLASWLTNLNDLSLAVESLTMLLSAMHILLRVIHMRYANKRLKVLLGVFVKKIWIRRKSHPLIFDRCIKNTNPVFYLSMTFWTAFSIFNILPIFEILNSNQNFASMTKRMPYLMYFPYDIQEPTTYIITYIVVFYSGVTLIFQYFTGDALVALNINFLSGQYEILHGKIMRLIPECHMEWRNTSTENNRNLRKLQKMYTKRLHSIVKYHNDLLSFSQILEDFLSYPIFINLGTSMLVLCFAAFQFVTSASNSLGEFAKFFIYFISLNVQLYIMCKMGSRLIARSTDTAIYLFKCNWEGGRISRNSSLILNADRMEVDELNHKMPLWPLIEYHPTDLEFQHNLRLMIMRSHRPVQLTAMKFAILSLESLNRIISSSLSYFALLNTIVNKED